MMPGAFNAAIALQIEQAGFPALYISGAGLANAAAGLPDIGLLSLEEVARLAGYIVKAIDIPALVDADTGFGSPADAVRRFERLGLAGMHLEDQVFPKRCGHLAGKELVPAHQMAARIRAAVQARKEKDFLVVARTDARSVEGFEAAVRRGQQYLKAGADALFPEALETATEFRNFASHFRGVPLLANMTEFGKSPLLTSGELAAMGYRMIILPLTCFRVSMRATETCLRGLKRKGTQRPWLRNMQTRKELYKLLHYDPSSPVWSRKNKPPA
jgi:methylisocitrate lyase